MYCVAPKITMPIMAIFKKYNLKRLNFHVCIDHQLSFTQLNVFVMLWSSLQRVNCIRNREYRITFSFDYSVNLSWLCFEKNMQCHSIFPWRIVFSFKRSYVLIMGVIPSDYNAFTVCFSTSQEFHWGSCQLVVTFWKLCFF